MKPVRRFDFRLLNRVQRLFIYSLGFSFLVTVLAVLLFEPVRRYLALPLEFIAWLFRSLYLLVPRQIMWVIFLVLAYWIAINSLQSRAKDPVNEQSPLPDLYAEPKIARLARYVTQSYRPFFRHRLNHTLTELSLLVLAYRLQTTPQQVRLLLSKGHLDLPPEVLEYFMQGLPPWPLQPGRPENFWTRLKPGRHAQAEALEQAEQALDFLEDYLEVPRER
jgi:hypothetical protein